MFWIFAGLLTVIAVAAVLYPLSRRPKELASADAYDLTVYKSQLQEIDGDVERGLIDKDEAEAARAEVARRLLNTQAALDKDLAADAAASAASGTKVKGKKGAKAKDAQLSMPKTATSGARMVAVVSLLVIPFCAFGLYFMLGTPNLEGQPLAQRLSKSPEQQSLVERVAAVERILQQNPDSLQGWKAIAPIYLSMRRANDAIRAYHNILRLEGETVENLSNLGEAIVVKDAGIVKPVSFGMFKRAYEMDKSQPKPRFFIAIGLGQMGQEQKAIEEWQAMITDFGESAPWAPFAKSQIAALEKKLAAGNGGTPNVTPPHGTRVAKDEQSAGASDAGNKSAGKGETELSGPTREDMEAAAQMTPEERQEMIENMVSQMAERLDEEGGSANDWVRLIRAEMVLNRPDKAAKTVSKAMKALNSDSDGLEKIKAAARSLGLSVTQ
jgi:cytochrome c-type biogenesis protein CcmH